MVIHSIKIHRFGAIDSYEAALAPELNWIHCPAAEMAAALAFLLCSSAAPVIPEQWLREDTRISAKICLADRVYMVSVTPQLGRLQLSALDSAGADATAEYQYILSHCPEQDDSEMFDGQDPSTPLRLCRYYCREEIDDLADRTRRIADTDTFRSHLRRYIQEFSAEPINDKKNYMMTIDPQGKFTAYLPGCPGEIFLSETEQKLFRYICFLNIAEFWEQLQKIRDLHHEKKPLLIHNFVEFLDESADISGLLTRTQKLARQIVILYEGRA